MKAALTAVFLGLALLAVCSSAQQPATTAKATLPSSISRPAGIAGTWVGSTSGVLNALELQFTATVTGTSTSIAGVFNTTGYPGVTGTGVYYNSVYNSQAKSTASVEPKHRLFGKYPVYKVLFSGEEIGGPWTLVLADRNTILGYPGYDVDIEIDADGPVSMPGQWVAKRIA